MSGADGGAGPGGADVGGAGRAGRADAGPLLARCDPAVLLAVVVAVPVVLVPLVDPRPVLVLWLAATVGAVLAGGLRLPRLLRAQVPFLGFAASVLVVNAVTRDGGTVAVVGPLVVTDTGLATGAALALRTLVVGVAAVTMLAVVDPGRLLTSLHVVGRLPAQATVALMVAHRVVQDLPADWATVRRAQALRGPTVRWARPARHGSRSRRGPDEAPTVRLPADVRSVGAAAFALLATTIRRAERMAVVLETRGYGALPPRERTTWHEARVGPRDAVLAVVVLGACLGAVAAGQAP